MGWSGVIFPDILPELKTERLLLNEIKLEDENDCFQLCSNLEVMKFWALPAHQTIEETRSLILYLKSEFQKKQRLRWAIRSQKDSLMIGDIGFWRFVMPRARGELAVKLLPSFWNHGYMTEAMTAVLDFSFSSLKLNSIEANIDPENGASLKLFEKLGFERIGLIKEHSFCPYRNHFTDTLLFSLRASQWKSFEPSS